jgi:hypothetical protein
MSRLFVQLIKRVSEKEDVFTECLAAALQEDSGLAREFLHRLCGKTIDGHDIAASHLAISTQRGFPATQILTACRVDMVFTVNGTTTIGVENKLFADEGPNQLQKYLRLELSRVAYIRAREANVSEDVRGDSRYLKPANRSHFLWSDFYFDVDTCAHDGSASPLTRALRELFLHYSFEPPKPEIGDLRDPDRTISENRRRQFAKLWALTESDLRRMGWKHIAPGSIAELYVNDGVSSRVKQAWLDPTWGRGLLRIRLTPFEGKESDLADVIRSTDLPYGDDVDLQLGHAPRRVRDHEYVELTISLRKLLGQTKDPETMKKVLAEFVVRVFEAAG